MHMDSPPSSLPEDLWRPHHNFGANVALGQYDLWAWEAHYSPERWTTSAEEASTLEADLDGTRESEVSACGWPEGFGVVMDAWRSGWDPEVGSQEEIAFLAAVALKETEGLEDGTRAADYRIRSHMLLAVLRAAFLAREHAEKEVEKLKKGFLDAGRLEYETKAEKWIREGLQIMKPYVQDRYRKWPGSAQRLTELFREILEGNGQLFARYKLSPLLKKYDFELGPRK